MTTLKYLWQQFVSSPWQQFTLWKSPNHILNNYHLFD